MGHQGDFMGFKLMGNGMRFFAGGTSVWICRIISSCSNKALESGHFTFHYSHSIPGRVSLGSPTSTGLS